MTMISSNPASTLNLGSTRRPLVINPVFNAISAVLLPSLVALVISATFVGHGQISGGSILKVLEMMAQASGAPAIAP